METETARVDELSSRYRMTNGLDLLCEAIAIRLGERDNVVNVCENNCEVNVCEKVCENEVNVSEKRETNVCENEVDMVEDKVNNVCEDKNVCGGFVCEDKNVCGGFVWDNEANSVSKDHHQAEVGEKGVDMSVCEKVLDELESLDVLTELVPRSLMRGNVSWNEVRLWDVRKRMHAFCEAVGRLSKSGCSRRTYLSDCLIRLLINLCRRPKKTTALLWVQSVQRAFKGLAERDKEFVLSYSGQWSEPIEDARTFLLKHQDHFIKATEDLARLCLRLSKQNDGSPRLNVFRAFERLDAMDDQTLKEYMNPQTDCGISVTLSLSDQVRVKISRLNLPDFHKPPVVITASSSNEEATTTTADLGETLAYLFIGLAGLLNPYHHDTNWPKVLQEKISRLNDRDRLLFLHLCGDSWLTTETSSTIKDSNTTWSKLLDVFVQLSGFREPQILRLNLTFLRIATNFRALYNPIVMASKVYEPFYPPSLIRKNKQV